MKRLGIISKTLLLLLAAFFALSPAKTLAMTQEQRNVIDSGARYFNVAENCPADGSGVGTNSTGTPDLKGFVDKYGKIAFDTGKKYGIPYEAILGQGSLESDNGNSGLTKDAFNFHGLKAGSSWKGPVWTGATKEQTPGGSEYTIQDAFRSFPNTEAGFAGYGDFITGNSRYKNALNYPGNPEQYIRELKVAGYATDVDYINNVVKASLQVANYVKEKGLFPPSSQVTPDVKPPDATAVSSTGGCADVAATAGGTANSNKQIAKQILSQKGLGDAEFQCLDKLWTRESQWKVDALNDNNGNGRLDEDRSDAYGIPQSLPANKMAVSGADWKTNPTTQITWGITVYIQGRYQTPCAAWAHSENKGWY